MPFLLPHNVLIPLVSIAILNFADYIKLILNLHLTHSVSLLLTLPPIYPPDQLPVTSQVLLLGRQETKPLTNKYKGSLTVRTTSEENPKSVLLY